MSYQNTPDWQPTTGGSGGVTSYSYQHQPPAQSPYGYGQPPMPGYGYAPAPQRPKKDNGVLIAVIIGAVILVCTLLLTLAPILFLKMVSSDLETMSGGQTEQILREDLDVEFGTFVTERTTYSESGQLAVTLTNKGDDRATFTVTVEAVNADGQRIADDIAIANNLGPGQSVTEDVFILVSEDEYDDMKRATINVIEATKY